MKLIVLTGSSTCGKTTTLGMTYDALITKSAVLTPKQKLGGNQHDFSALLSYAGQKVAFFTMGDYSGHLINAINAFDRGGCDVLICACNNRFKRPFKVFPRYSHHILNKRAAISQAMRVTENTSDANAIVALI